MRRLLKNALWSLITGLCFGAGVLTSVAIYREVKATLAPATVDFPQGFDFPTHERVRDQARFTVRGTIRNSGDTGWDTVKIVAGIYAGSAYMTYCWSDLRYVPARSTRPFEVICKNTEGTKVPDNITYRLSVRTATMRTGTAR
ncbi:MAG: hypothetical protein WCA32_15510 [Chromatiaceae bacterium]